MFRCEKFYIMRQEELKKKRERIKDIIRKEKEEDKVEPKEDKNNVFAKLKKIGLLKEKR